jgi:hypothetical protein
MAIDDGPVDRHPVLIPLDFVVYRPRIALDMIWIDFEAGIANRDEDATRLHLHGA